MKRITFILSLLILAFTGTLWATANVNSTRFNVNSRLDSSDVIEIAYTAVHDDGSLTIAIPVPSEMDSLDIRSSTGSWQNVNLFNGSWLHFGSALLPSTYVHGSTDVYGRYCFTFDVPLSEFVLPGEYFIRLSSIYHNWSDEVPISYTVQ